jgi:hypothetical protein
MDMTKEESMTDTDPGPFDGWVILELMGHRRLAGRLTEQQIAGSGFLRLDIPCEPPVTQFYSPSAVYAITPASEVTARQAAGVLSRPAPVEQWEIAPPVRREDPDEDGGPW